MGVNMTSPWRNARSVVSSCVILTEHDNKRRSNAGANESKHEAWRAAHRRGCDKEGIRRRLS